MSTVIKVSVAILTTKAVISFYKCFAYKFCLKSSSIILVNADHALKHFL